MRLLKPCAKLTTNGIGEADRQAILHRYALISGNDPRGLAEETRFPVYLLTGFFDPIVPWMFVHPWLKRNCPGYRGWKLIWRAHHNVLGSAPRASAEQVLAWMNRPGPSANPER